MRRTGDFLSMAWRRLSRDRRRLGRRLAFEPLETRNVLSTTVLASVADTYVRDDSETRGGEQYIDVRGFEGADFVGYVRIDLSQLEIEQIEDATLSLYKVAGSRNDVLNNDRHEVQGLLNLPGNTPQDWVELGGGALNTVTAGIEYDVNAANSVDLTRVFDLDPQRGANVTEFVSNDLGVATTISGPDLVTFLNDRVADGGLVTFIVSINANNNRGYGFASKENSDPALHPTLELVYTAGEPIPDPDPDPSPDPDPDPEPALMRQMEYLNRGIVAVRNSTNQVYVGWRLLGTEPLDLGFNLYRSAGGGDPVKLNVSPLTQTTDFVDNVAGGLNTSVANTYFVRPVIDGEEQEPSESFTLAANAPVRQYIPVPLQRPAGGQTPTGENYVYHANDVSVGDVTGDGQYEFIVKWDPSNSKDNSQSGFTGNVYVDAYTLAGELLWRIDLGVNIRAGAHYTQFLVYDFDGDGRAEVVMKTAPGTIDGQGNNVLMSGHDPLADFRNSSGYILTGPEYLTVFDGLTGAELATVPYVPARGSASEWGDSYGNRVDRFLAGVAYLDGERPSIIMSRGYYGPQGGFSSARNEIAAYNWRDGELTLEWHFRANLGGRINSEYVAQGAHSLSIADVDGDGFDEIIYGAAVINHDGTGLHSTGWGHGDALHVSNMDPSRPGLEIFMPHESPSQYGPNAMSLRDAATGELLLGVSASSDIGRGLALDVDPRYPGYELWGSGGTGGMYTVSLTTPHATDGPRGVQIASNKPSINFGVWWDADPLRELLDGTTISKWNWPSGSGSGSTSTLLSPGGISSNNGTKANPALSADIFGDWREEVIWRTNNSSELRIYTTVIPANPNHANPDLATPRIYTLMHDSQYRSAIAWQNAGYNQPPHTSFFLGAGMDAPPVPNIYTVQYGVEPPNEHYGDYNDDGVIDAADYTVWRDRLGTESLTNRDPANEGPVGPADFDTWKAGFGAVAPASGSGLGVATSASVEGAVSASAPAVEASVVQTGTTERSLNLWARSIQPAEQASRPVRQVFTAASESSPVDRAMLLLAAPSQEQVLERVAIERARTAMSTEQTDRLAANWDAAFEQFAVATAL